MGKVRRPFDAPEVEENLSALGSWNSGFEVPDVIAFDDVIRDRRALAAQLLASQQSPSWGRALHFPYPNGADLRDMIVLSPLDLALVRAAAGRISRRVERRLSPRAFGSRTKPDGAAWKFHDGKAEWVRFTNTAVGLLQRGDLNAMCSTDIAGYYASINLDRLELRLHDLGCDVHAIAVILSGLRTGRRMTASWEFQSDPRHAASSGTPFSSRSIAC